MDDGKGMTAQELVQAVKLNPTAGDGSLISQ